ncbi:MAG TPA: alpha-amylase family protein [Motilibacterales bacterium]|nr:alpha-amylase family protein [Motilibacterales bacterium]
MSAPGSRSDLRSHLARTLGPDPDAAQVLARWERWGADLVNALATVYPQDGVGERVVEIIAAGHSGRTAALRARDRERILSPDWFQRPDAVGYACYTDRFAGTLNGVAQRVDYLRELGVTYLHLMPLLEPRPGANDGGYAVMDYGRVREDLGTMADLEALAGTLHDNGISLTLDLVLNHVAAEHAWAVAARAGDPKHRQYFYVYPDRTEPDGYEESLPEVFPDFAPGNFTWDDDLQGWVWTTFNAWQWDVNWSNPDVVCEFIAIILNLANHGVDCLRLDAIAFVWKRLGTDCQNQPEVHAITQVMRAAARIAAPSLIFKAEAIVAPSQLVAYLGRGQHAGRVSDIAYHNSLMVQIWSALASRDARLMAVAMSRFPDIPTTTGWATYLRCHDDIGWAIDDGDCAAIGWNGWSHRSFLSDFFIGAHPASFAEGAAFQENPATGDRRISGSAASLAGLGTARTPGQRGTAIDRVLLGYAMVLGFGGIPLIYMGDELALRNDDDYAAVPEHADDNRWMHRPVMPWHLAEARNDPSTDAGRTWAGLRRLIDVRRELDSLHAAVPTRVIATSHPAVVLFVRKHPAGDLVQVYNLSDWNVTIPEGEIQSHGHGLTFDRLTDREVHPHDGLYALRPYTAWWLTQPDV